MEEKKTYNFDELDDDQLKDISNTISDILYKRREEEKELKLTLLKDEYEKKYFVLNNYSKIIYVDTIENEYLWSGWKATNTIINDGEHIEVNIQYGMFRDGLFVDKFRMNGDLMYKADILDAHEISRKEAYNRLNTANENIKFKLGIIED